MQKSSRIRSRQLLVVGAALLCMAAAPAPQIAPAPEPAPAPATRPGDPLPLATDGWPGHRRGVAGGPHDFTDVTGRMGDACSACHVPHVQAIRPLTATQPSTQPAIEMFRIGGQRAVFVPGRYTPGPTSLICLGCHDGTVASSTIGSAHAMLAGAREGFRMPDGFVWRDHPIGVPYPSDRRASRPQGFVEQQLRLPDGRIECISCHDPHNAKGLPAMLAVSNRRSNLCVTCHLK